MAVNYVKFQRGTQAAYNKLANAVPSRLDENTLYFIYPEDNSSVGKLYLGSRLISGGDVVLASTSLADLSDVIVESVKANSFLVQNAEGKWDNLSLADVANLIKNSANLISELIVEDDDVVILNANGNKITGSHAEVGPTNGASKGATADASISNFGESLQIKVPYVSVDKYGHTTVVDEKTLSISIPEAPSFIDTNTTYELRYENDEEGKKVIRLYDNSGAIVSTIDASEFIKDGMLDDVSYNTETNELTFVWNTSAGKTNDVVKLTDILDPYNAGNGININGNEISVKLASGEKNLVINENGLSSNFDLANYATNEVLNEKVDKQYELIPQIDLTSGKTLTESDFNGGTYYTLVDGKYVLAEEYNADTIYYSQAIDDNGALVYDKIPYELISPEDKEKLNKLVFDEDGGISVSGNINISQVQGLNGYLKEEHFSTPVIEKLNYITSVNENYFTVSEAHKLEFNFIKNVDESVFSISDVKTDEVDEYGANIVKPKVLQLKSVPAAALTTALGDLSTVPMVTLRDGKESNTIVDNINHIYDILTWGDMT